MGAFFDNYQVLIAGQHQIDSVRSIVLDYFAKLGWRPSSADDSDRTVALSPPSSSGWVTVYDYGPDSSSSDSTDTLVSHLSKAMNTTTASISVHDSDVLDMSLFRNGECLDTYCSDPEYFSGQEADEPGGKLEVWLSLLLDDLHSDALLDAWRANGPFAEDNLEDLATLFGWSLPGCLVGFESLEEAWDLDELTWIHLKSQATARAEGLMSSSSVLEDAAGFYPEVNSYIGYEVLIGAHVRNVGAKSTGLWVTVGGPAIEKELLYPEQIRLWTSGNLGDTEIVAPLVRMKDNEPLTFSALINDIVLPPGIPDDGILSAKSPGALRHLLSNRQKSTISATIHLKTCCTGNGLVQVGFFPQENPQEGLVALEVPVRVASLPGRPLGAKLDTQPAILELLQTQKVLFSFLAVAGDLGAVLDTTIETACEWVSLLAQHSDRVYQTEFMDREGRTRSRKWPIRELALKKRWVAFKKKLAKAENLTVFMAPTRTPECNYICPDETGLAISIYPQDSAKGQESCLCYVTCWIQTDDPAVAFDPKASTRLEELTECAFRSGLGLQAFVGHWQYPPRHHTTPTAYEFICGVQPDYSSANWCKRNLRGITERMWLGPSFSSELETLGLECTVEGVQFTDYGVKVHLRDDQGLRGLEKYLQPLMEV